VDLIDHDGADRLERVPGALGGEVQVERLGGGDEDVRRPLHHRRALGGRRVAGAHHDADVGELKAAVLSPDAELGERLEEVLLDVVAQGLQGRDVEDPGLVAELPLRGVAEEPVEAGEEGGERLARARRRGDEHVSAGADDGPAANLGLGGLAQALGEPSLHHRMKGLQRIEGPG